MCEDERCRHSMFCRCKEQCAPLTDPEPIELDDEEGAIKEVHCHEKFYESYRVDDDE